MEQGLSNFGGLLFPEVFAALTLDWNLSNMGNPKEMNQSSWFEQRRPMRSRS